LGGFLSRIGGGGGKSSGGGILSKIFGGGSSGGGGSDAQYDQLEKMTPRKSRADFGSFAEYASYNNTKNNTMMDIAKEGGGGGGIGGLFGKIGGIGKMLGPIASIGSAVFGVGSAIFGGITSIMKKKKEAKAKKAEEEKQKQEEMIKQMQEKDAKAAEKAIKDASERFDYYRQEINNYYANEISGMKISYDVANQEIANLSATKASLSIFATQETKDALDSAIRDMQKQMEQLIYEAGKQRYAILERIAEVAIPRDLRGIRKQVRDAMQDIHDKIEGGTISKDEGAILLKDALDGIQEDTLKPLDEALADAVTARDEFLQKALDEKNQN